MFADYAIYIRDRNGEFRDRIINVESVDIVEILNESGSWTIKSTTPEQCPFTAGDGIVIYKNGRYYYSGIVKKIKETYNAYDKQYSWTVQGSSDIEYLKRRICYVDTETGSTTENSYYTDTGPVETVIKNIIDKNVGVSAMESRREPTIAETIVTPSTDIVSVSLRFPTILKAIVPLLDAKNMSIEPLWDADRKKLIYQIRNSNDLSRMLLFSTELNSILSVDFLSSAPTGNFIMSGGKGDLTERAFAYAQDDASIDEWGRIEYFRDVRNIEAENLQSDADTTLEKSAVENVGYSAELSTDSAYLQYRVDWNLGDFVGFVIEGKTSFRRVLQVQTTLTYERETLMPTIGTIERGNLVGIFAQLEQLRSDVDHLEWSNS